MSSREILIVRHEGPDKDVRIVAFVPADGDVYVEVQTRRRAEDGSLSEPMIARTNMRTSVADAVQMLMAVPMMIGVPPAQARGPVTDPVASSPAFQLSVARQRAFGATNEHVEIGRAYLVECFEKTGALTNADVAEAEARISRALQQSKS